jgi:hypothetical protein
MGAHQGAHFPAGCQKIESRISVTAATSRGIVHYHFHQRQAHYRERPFSQEWMAKSLLDSVGCVAEN